MILHIVTGAPGAGKTTALEAFLALKTNYIAFDIDWLIHSASALAQRNIFSDETTWPAYGQLWFDVLQTAARNGYPPVFFTPNTPADLDHLGRPDWCTHMRWILLDCPDRVRRERLRQRMGWTETNIQEALEDAEELRGIIPHRLDTSADSPDEIASLLLDWLKN